MLLIKTLFMLGRTFTFILATCPVLFQLRSKYKPIVSCQISLFVYRSASGTDSRVLPSTFKDVFFIVYTSIRYTDVIAPVPALKHLFHFQTLCRLHYSTSILPFPKKDWGPGDERRENLENSASQC